MSENKNKGSFGGRLLKGMGNYSTDAQRFGAAVARAKWKKTVSGRDSQKYVEKLAAFTAAFLEPVTQKYMAAGYESALCAKKELEKTPVWFCWWQGEEYMPDTVRLCYARLQRMTPDTARVHLVTLKNVKDYLDFPPVIGEKYYRRELNLSALADILRASLLCAYGGVWIDATVYAAKPLDDAVLSAPFFSPKLHYAAISAPSQGLWNSKLLSVRKNPVSMNYLRDAFTLWWEENDAALDGRQFDYFLLNAYRKLETVRAEIDAVAPNNVPFDALQILLNEPYSHARYAALEAQCDFFDLSSDAPWQTQTLSGEETLYGFLCRREFGK